MWKRQALLAPMLKLSLSKSSKTYQVLGTELLKSGKYLQKSIFPLKWATTIISHNFSTQSDSAEALFELGEEKEAFASIKKELSLNPLDQDLHRILIQKLEEKNRLEDLESFSKEVIEMIADPKSVFHFHLRSANALVRHNMFPQALLAYREAMKNDPPIVHELCCKYGEALQHEGLYEEALVQFEKVNKNLSSGENFFLVRYEKRARSGAAYLDYCLGRVQKAKEEFEKIMNEDRLDPSLTTIWNYILILCHLQDEKMIKHYKANEFKGWFPLPEGDKWIRFYEQELKITQKILQRDDIDENMRKFNTKKLEALNVFLPILRETIEEEAGKQKFEWA